MTLKAIHNHIVFQFLDKINSAGLFEESKSDGGIFLNSHHSESSKQSRWVKIISLGPDCSNEIRVPGCEVLVENLRWTESAKYKGQSYWRTDETQLLGYRYPGME